MKTTMTMTALAVVLTASGGARADGSQSGTLTLSRSEIAIAVPPGSEWAAPAPEPNSPNERVERTNPDSPILSGSFAPLKVAARCAQAVPAIAASAVSGVVASPVAVPGWFPQAAVAPGGESIDATMCADVPDGILLFRLSYSAGTLSPTDATQLRAFLAAALRGERAASDPLFEAADADVALSHTGMKVHVPAGADEWIVGLGDAGMDAIVRLKPNAPRAYVEVSLRKRACGSGAKPSYLSERFATGFEGKNAQGTSISACANTPHGSADVEVTYAGPPSSADFADIPPLLDAIAQGAGATLPTDDDASDTISMPALGISVDVPASGVRWQLQGARPGSDMLTRRMPYTPLVHVSFRRAQGTCDGATAPAGSQEVARPPYVPASYASTVQQRIVPESSMLEVVACATTNAGPLVAEIEVEGARVEDADGRDIEALLEAVGKEAGAVASKPSFAPRSVHLEATGYDVTLPGGHSDWSVEMKRSNDGKETLDVLTRSDAEGSSALPRLVTFVKYDGASPCATMVPNEVSPGKGQLTNEAFLPPTWYPQAKEVALDDGSGLTRVDFCLDVRAGTVVHAWLLQRGALAPAMADDVRQLLGAFAAAALPPAPPPSPQGSIAPAPATPDNPITSPPPAPDTSEPAPRARLVGDDRIDVGLHQLTPKNGALDAATGATVAFDLAHVSRAPVGFAWTLRLAGGADTKASLAYDGRVGIGMGVTLGPVTLAPIVGVGLEGTTGGADKSYDVPSNANWYLEGRARVRAGSSWAVDAAASRVARSAFSGPAPETEVRGSLRLSKRRESSTELSGGAEYVDYGDAKQIGAVVGIGF